MSLIAFSSNAFAQETISIEFATAIPVASKLSTDQRLLLKEKIEQLLARTNTSGNIESTPFVIVPDIIIETTSVSEGTIYPVTMIQGKLVLLVKNKYDGTVFNELSINLVNTIKENVHKDAISLLIDSININEPRFVKFIKISQKRILERYKDDGIVIP